MHQEKGQAPHRLPQCFTIFSLRLENQLQRQLSDTRIVR